MRTHHRMALISRLNEVPSINLDASTWKLSFTTDNKPLNQAHLLFESEGGDVTLPVTVKRGKGSFTIVSENVIAKLMVELGQTACRSGRFGRVQPHPPPLHTRRLRLSNSRIHHSPFVGRQTLSTRPTQSSTSSRRTGLSTATRAVSHV